MSPLQRVLDKVFGTPDTAHGSGGRATPDPMARAAAALLIEAATVDGTFGSEERQLIGERLAAHFGLAGDGVTALMTAAEADVEHSSQLFGFTQRLVTDCDADERVELVEMLWDVAWADGTVHDFEAALIRRICGLLHVTDRDSGAARKRAQQRHEAAGPPPSTNT